MRCGELPRLEFHQNPTVQRSHGWGKDRPLVYLAWPVTRGGGGGEAEGLLRATEGGKGDLSRREGPPAHDGTKKTDCIDTAPLQS